MLSILLFLSIVEIDSFWAIPISWNELPYLATKISFRFWAERHSFNTEFLTFSLPLLRELLPSLIWFCPLLGTYQYMCSVLIVILMGALN